MAEFDEGRRNLLKVMGAAGLVVAAGGGVALLKRETDHRQEQEVRLKLLEARLKTANGQSAVLFKAYAGRESEMATLLQTVVNLAPQANNLMQQGTEIARSLLGGVLGSPSSSPKEPVAFTWKDYLTGMVVDGKISLPTGVSLAGMVPSFLFRTNRSAARDLIEEGLAKMVANPELMAICKPQSLMMSKLGLLRGGQDKEGDDFEEYVVGVQTNSKQGSKDVSSKKYLVISMTGKETTPVIVDMALTKSSQGDLVWRRPESALAWAQSGEIDAPTKKQMAIDFTSGDSYATSMILFADAAPVLLQGNRLLEQLQGGGISIPGGIPGVQGGIPFGGSIPGFGGNPFGGK